MWIKGWCADMIKIFLKKLRKLIYDKCFAILLDDDYEKDFDRNYSKYLRYYRKKHFKIIQKNI